ncbi:MAG: amino acid adenylation domain-containing protein, partial [bacterium]|nr:amino acid adenylation domain-containing protein [bacterium]
HPRERLAFLIADADPPVVLTQEHLASRLPASSAAVVCLDARWPEIDRHRPTRPLAAAAPGDLAYVIHTSGSTGRPKGVGVSHRAICNLLAWMQRTYGLEAGDRVLQKTPMSFDVSVWEFFWPLACGARLVLARPGEHRDPAALIALIRAQEITILHFVPSMLRAFLEQPEAASCTTVRRVTCGGEALPRELEQRFFATLPEARLHHLYGPAEAAVDVTLWSCRRGDSRSSVPIGRAIDNVRILLLDAGMVPVPPGVKGELHVGGVALARGYWRRPGLTAASFVPDPFGRRRGERLYKTGDLARCGADGVVEFLGRSDHQVKIRGMRVELGEIETVLGRHPEVRETAVQAVPDAAGGNRLVAWVVPRRPGEMAKGELISWLEAELPAYMVPPAFVEIDELPLTRTGKLDRRRLPAPEPTDDDEQFVAPRTPVEAKLAKIWRQVLDLERVGVNDSFFRLGGHSLLGTRLMLRIREQLGRELPLRALFEAPTVAGLARRIATAARSEMPPLLPRPPGDPLSLSFAQERMLFLDRLNPGSGVYNIPSAWKLIGPLDQTALRHALGTIADRHEVLRTCFPTLADQPVQRITPRPERPLAIVDLTVLRAAEREPELKRLAVEEARRPFDLARGPLLRSTLVKLAAEESGLLITMHHIVSDAWSLGIFFGELTALYAAFCRRRPAPLPPLGIQYADFAAWQHRWLTGAVIEEHLAFWTRRLEGVLPLDLPGDRPRPVVQRLRGANVNLRLSATLSDGIRRLGQAHGATLYMTLLAAFQTLLGRWAGQTDFVVGTPIANRGRIELEGLIGFFINTLTMRANLAGDPTFATLLARTADESLDAYHYQDLPFEKLVEHLDPQRDLSRNPIFQVTFVLQNAPMPEVRTAELTVKPLMTGHATTRFDLGLQLWEGQEGIFGSVAYDADLFDPTTIRRLVRHFALLLEAVVERPELRLGAVPQLAAAEHHQIVTEWRVGARVSPAAGTVSELFAARVERTPAAPAVVSGDRELSYRQLERRANHLARRLRALGIGPPASRGRSEIPVALFAERGPEVVIGLLGILKAGGVYLPLDPAAPRERLARQLRDAGAPVVLVGRTVADALPAVHGAEIVDLDAAAAGESSEAPVGLPDPDHLAYLIYTSGTTGEPKGVAVSHRQVVPVLSWFLDYYGFDERTRVLQTLSHCFDFGVRELLTTLLGGGTLFFLPPEEQADPACYLDAIARRQLNTVLATPSFFRELIAAGRPLPELEIVHLGAEALSRDLAEEIRKVVGARCRVYNGYGLTEAAVNNTVFRIAGVVRTPTVPIGRASAANQVSVLNPQGRPQPIGVPGELVVGGPGVARGYLKRPALTAERFVPDPNAHGRRLYRSGDLVRFLGDGNLEFLGRIDRQFKVRGFRIEPGEIEAALRELPAVREAVAAVHEDRPGDQRLVAYLVPGDESVPDPGELRHFLGTRMPESMVPATFVTLTALPLTATGKLDRAALPDPAAIEHVEYRGPRTPIEAKLIATWHRLLGVERVGIDDDFFVLGGHSLLATRLISQIRRELDCELPLRAVFEASTVAGLARRIATAVPGTSRPSIRRVPREKALPLSFAQERMWLLDQLTGGSAIYNLASAWRLIGPLEVPALAAAFSAVVGRHEALRTSFPAPA